MIHSCDLTWVKFLADVMIQKNFLGAKWQIKWMNPLSKWWYLHGQYDIIFHVYSFKSHLYFSCTEALLNKKNQNIESYFHGIVYRVNKIVQERLFCFAGTRTEFTTFIQIRNRLEYHLHVKNLEAVYKNVLTASNQFMFIFFLAIKSIPNNLIFYE